MMLSASSRTIEDLERLARVLSEYNCAACLQRGFAQADSSPDAIQSWDCDFGAVRKKSTDAWETREKKLCSALLTRWQLTVPQG